MEVILRKKINELGDRGEVVEVKSGYARNYLIPSGLAMAATTDAKLEIERDHAREQKKIEERLGQLREVANQLEKTSCTIAAQANDEGHLYGSISENDITAAFNQEGIELDPSQIILETSIKEIGVYGFQVQLAQGIEVATKVWVVKE